MKVLIGATPEPGAGELLKRIIGATAEVLGVPKKDVQILIKTSADLMNEALLKYNDIDLVFTMEKFDRDSNDIIGEKRISKWVGEQMAKRVILICPEETFKSSKIRRLYHAGLMTAVRIDDCNDAQVIADLYQYGRTDEEACAYYGIVKEEPVEETPVILDDEFSSLEEPQVLDEDEAGEVEVNVTNLDALCGTIKEENSDGTFTVSLTQESLARLPESVSLKGAIVTIIY